MFKVFSLNVHTIIGPQQIRKHKKLRSSLQQGLTLPIPKLPGQVKFGLGQVIGLLFPCVTFETSCPSINIRQVNNHIP